MENVHSDKYIILEVFEARDGKNIGPGKTLELCKEHLNCPFIALGCDTLGDFDIALEEDWITVSKKSIKSKNLFGEYAYYDYKTNEIKELSTQDIKDNPNMISQLLE